LSREKHLKAGKTFSLHHEGATWQIRGYSTKQGAYEALFAFFFEQEAKERLYLRLQTLVAVGGWLFA
jgi:hypothetical protein